MLSSTTLIIYRLFIQTRPEKFTITEKNDNTENTKLNPSTSDYKATLTNITKPGNKLEFKKHRNNQIRTKQKRNQTYKLLLTLNVIFFVLVTPIVLVNAFEVFSLEMVLLRNVAYILAYMNSCVNIVFYILTCETYKNILVKKIKSIIH